MVSLEVTTSNGVVFESDAIIDIGGGDELTRSTFCRGLAQCLAAMLADFDNEGFTLSVEEIGAHGLWLFVKVLDRHKVMVMINYEVPTATSGEGAAARLDLDADGLLVEIDEAALIGSRSPWGEFIDDLDLSMSGFHTALNEWLSVYREEMIDDVDIEASILSMNAAKTRDYEGEGTFALVLA